MSGKLEVVFITRKWPPAMGGMETWSVEVAKQLKLRDTLILHALPGRENGRVPSIPSLVWFGLKELFLLSFGKRKDVILGGDMAIWPLVWVGRAGIKVIAAHGSDVGFAWQKGLRSQLYKHYMRLGAKLLKNVIVIANSGTTEKNAVRIGFKRVEIIPLAATIFVPPPQERPEDFLLFAGRLMKSKGCGWFVREVLPLVQGVDLKIAGTFWDESEEHVLSNSRVTYLGCLSQKELVELMRRATAVVLPNMWSGKSEGFGLVAVEAAAVGGVVLASNCGGIKDAIIDGTTGFLLEPEEPMEWTSAIERIVSWQDEDRRRFARVAQRKAEEYFNWGRVGEDIRRLWD